MEDYVKKNFVSLTDEDILIGIYRGEFSLVYQPIVCLNTQEIIGYEALARWNSVPRLGRQFTPDVFTNIGAIHTSQELTKYLIVLAEEAKDLIRLPIHFNVTCFDLNLGIETTLKEIEVTETFFVPESIPSINQLAKDKNIWIDDLGAGACAWQYLPEINLTGVKLDRNLTRLLPCTPQNLSCQKSHELIYSIVDLAKKWNIKIVAEWIETEEQFLYFKDLTIDYGQGWFFGRPQTLSEIMGRVV